MSDPTEGIRRAMVKAINSEEMDYEGQTWTTDQLTQEFEVVGFLAPFVMVKHKTTGEKGTLMFKHSPRVYFEWSPN